MRHATTEPGRAPDTVRPRTPGFFVPFPKDAIEQSLGARFEEQTRRHPDRPAVRTPRHRWTYAELNHVANRIAHAILAARGVREEPIAIILEQGALLVAAILGALKAGKIYVPLDPAFPAAHVAALLADSTATLVVSATGALDSARSVAPAGVGVLDAAELAGRGPADDPGVPVSAAASAYIYYTSGSTGRPKGVRDTHRNVLHNIMRYTNSLQVAAGDRLTLLQGPAFSGAVSSVFAALLNGATTCPFDVRTEGVNRIGPWLRDEAITIYHSVPALFRQVMATAPSLPGLRLIRLEGDGATPRDVALFQRRFSPPCVLVNGLGATECGLVRQYFIGVESLVPPEVVPIGYPVEDMDVVVLDDAGGTVPPGQVGEIAVRSRYLAAGYWGRPDLTHAAFTPVPGVTGLRQYRTGDLGRMQPDGCLHHLGRKDARPKIRGHRVVVADVEAALLAMDGVREAVVTVRPDAAVEPRLVAYIVPSAWPPPTASALRRHLSARLPDFMVPSVYVPLDRLPLTDHAKVDRSALPAPPRARPRLDVPFVGPADLLQQELAAIWETLLGVRPVGAHDDFFDLGGDSLLAVRMMDEVERALGRRLPLTVMLEAATIRHLADGLRREAADLLAPVVPVQPAGRRRPFFFLHGDYLSGGFFCHALARHLGPDQPLYVLPPCGLDGRPVPPSYQAMAEQHVEAMRTVQPEGPYRLGGLCNGGLVAYEMARRLARDGYEVEVLLPIAAAGGGRLAWLRRVAARITAPRPDGRVDPHPLAPWLRDAIRWLEDPSRVRLKPLYWRGRTSARDIGRALTGLVPGRTGGMAPAPTPAGRPASEASRGLRAIYQRIDDAYVPQPYGGRVTLLWPADDPVAPREAARRWRRVAPQLEVRVVPGDHITCLTRQVEAAAREISRCLEPAHP